MKILVTLLLLSGCVSQPVSITYEADRFGVPVPVVDGVRYEMTEAERDFVGRKFIAEYCAAK